MHYLLDFINIILHLNLYLGQFVDQYGAWVYALLFLIIFCETGLVITPFLPGDSLLFAAGTIFAASNRTIYFLIGLLIIASFCGDNTNYWIGRWVGPRVFKRHARFFKYQYLLIAQKFYEKHGGKAVVIARFLPLFRTFIPFVAGISQMHYRRYLIFSFCSACLWVGSITYISYWFGNIPLVKNNFSVVIVIIICISLLPMVIHALRQWRAKKKATNG